MDGLNRADGRLEPRLAEFADFDRLCFGRHPLGSAGLESVGTLAENLPASHNSSTTTPAAKPRNSSTRPFHRSQCLSELALIFMDMDLRDWWCW